MTLVEVLAGLVVLGTLLTTVMIARGRFLRQYAEAERRMQATRAVDSLLGEWLAGPAEAVPIDARGPLAGGAAKQFWRTQPIRQPAATRLGAIVVRLEVFDSPALRKPIVAIEFLLAAPRPAAATQPSTAGAS